MYVRGVWSLYMYMHDTGLLSLPLPRMQLCHLATGSITDTLVDIRYHGCFQTDDLAKVSGIALTKVAYSN